MYTITIQPRDMLIARDGRPFGTDGSNRMYSLDWFYPSTLAGSLRTLLGKRLAKGSTNPFMAKEMLDRLKRVKIFGPFLIIEGELYFPSPKDLVLFEKESQSVQNENFLNIMPLRPVRLKEGEGCDLPHEELWPMKVSEDVKPCAAPFFWSKTNLEKWLGDDSLNLNLEIPKKSSHQAVVYGFFYGLEKEMRFHVSIDPGIFTAKDQHLFSKTGLVFPEEPDVKIIAAVDPGDDAEIKEVLKNLDQVHPFGGGRRLARYCKERNLDWIPSAQFKEKLNWAKGVRMVLSTPAIFKHGWLPGWIDPDNLVGAPPSLRDKGIQLKLRGACVGRWQAISGWSLEKAGRFGSNRKHKPVRRLVPAGSVYFFEVLEGNLANYVDDIWLEPVSDDLQDQYDGFGTAIWGIWNCEK
jgi:CRISPR-associated protein Cmr3